VDGKYHFLFKKLSLNLFTGDRIERVHSRRIIRTIQLCTHILFRAQSCAYLRKKEEASKLEE